MLIVPQTASATIQTGQRGLAAWRALSRNLDERLARFAGEPAIAREIAYVRDHLPEIGSADALVADRRLYEVALVAYDLDGQENAQALMRKVLTEDLADPRATANRMVDPRFKAIAGDFGFAPGAGAADRARMDRTVEQYVRHSYEQASGEKLPTITTDLQDQALAAFAERPEIAAEIAHFRGTAPTLTSPEAVAADGRLVAFAYRAAGFSGRPALDAEFLAEVIGDAAIREQFGDARWAAFAESFGSATSGRAARTDLVARDIDSIAQRWIKASFTLETGRQFHGVPNPQQDADLAAFAERADIKAEVAQFKKEIAGVDDAVGLIADASTYKFVLRAFDLESFGRNADMVLRTLSMPPDSRTSPAAQDSRFRALAEGLRFLGKDQLPATQDPAFVEELIGNYLRAQFERAIGGVDLDQRQALYAQRKLPTVTSAYQILGDTALRTVVFQALGLPSAASQDVDRLAGLLEKRLELGRLKEPDYSEKLIQRFFANAGTIANVAAVSSNSGVLTLLGTAGPAASGSTAAGIGIGLDLLLQVQGRR